MWTERELTVSTFLFTLSVVGVGPPRVPPPVETKGVRLQTLREVKRWARLLIVRVVELQPRVIWVEVVVPPVQTETSLA